MQKAMNFLVTGRKYKNSLDRAAWSYHGPLRSSPEFQKLEREYQAYKDAVEYANQGKASYVKKIEPSVFISIYANLIASSIYESAQPEVPWYQPTLYAEHRKAQKAVSEFMRDQDYKKG